MIKTNKSEFLQETDSFRQNIGNYHGLWTKFLRQSSMALKDTIGYFKNMEKLQEKKKQ